MLPERVQNKIKRGRQRDRSVELPIQTRRATEPRPSAREILTHTWPGRVFLAAVSLKVIVGLLQRLTPASAILEVLGAAATLALAFALSYFIVRLLVLIKRRLLWRVRRKLILSYVFIGFVPALLIVAFFLFAGLLMFFNISSYLLKNGLDELVDETNVIATTAAGEIQRSKGASAAREIVDRKWLNTAERYPGLSIALVPASSDAAAPGATRAQPAAAADLAAAVTAGPWRHTPPPVTIPEWLSRSRTAFAGISAFQPLDGDEEPKLLVRAIAWPESAGYAVVVDLPVDELVGEALRESTGIKIGDVTVVQPTVQGGITAPVRSRPRTPTSMFENSVAVYDYRDWETGRTGRTMISIGVGIADIYKRVSAAQSRVSGASLADLFLGALVVIAVLFLIIEFVALVMGFALAKSITGSVHQLFMGTERVRQGDFTHRIDIRTRDQFGELADSFNAMTASIEDLLVQAAEKKRLEEELRIARDIQMSLLPRGPFLMPGLAVTALCVPAREVGGDYYDFFPLGERRLGVLIADVSGKGTSAALYMAELKGLVLSLSQIYQSPKQLLVEVNRIISDNLDSRSFITMTYAVLDLDGGTLTYARAGHTPLIYLPSPGSGRVPAQILTPDGMVLGLRIDGVAAKFESLLEERTLSLTAGDVFVFFTDGISEAMNQESDLFGEGRLSALVEEHGHLPSEELRERILRDIEAFVAGADQHDDMTLILMKIEDVGATVAAQYSSRPAMEVLAPEG
jgi:sigma-B regulation protein RsbU (phosphoserine phosphatase)